MMTFEEWCTCDEAWWMGLKPLSPALLVRFGSNGVQEKTGFEGTRGFRVALDGSMWYFRLSGTRAWHCWFATEAEALFYAEVLS